MKHYVASSGKLTKSTEALLSAGYGNILKDTLNIPARVMPGKPRIQSWQMGSDQVNTLVTIMTSILDLFLHGYYNDHARKFSEGESMQTIETFVPITQAKAKFLDMVRQLQDTDDIVAITKNGVPEAVMLSMRKFQGFLETIDILADPAMMSQLRSSEKDVKNGRLIDIDEAF